MESILRTNNLTKKYGGQICVNNLCMNVSQGDIYGFIGKNGAGKSTTMKMILGLIPPTSGSFEVFGKNIKKGDISYLKNIGSIIEIPSSYENLTAYENLKIHATYMGIKDKKIIDEYLDKVGLLSDKDKKVKKFSLGMKQRLGIARAIMHNPKILLLDEPINGLDPLGIRNFRSFITDLVAEEKFTVIISSHILSELELIVNKVGIIDKGKMLKEDMLTTIKNECEVYIDIRVDDIVRAQDVLRRNLYINSEVIDDEIIRLNIKNEKVMSGDISKLFSDNNLRIIEISNKKENLEEYLIRMWEKGATK